MRLPRSRRRRIGLEHIGAADQDRLVERVQRIGVEQRQRREQHVALADSERARRIDAPPEHLRLRATHALGGTGRARRIEDRDRLARSQRGGRDPLAESRQRQSPFAPGAPSPIIQMRAGGETSASSVSIAGKSQNSITSNCGVELRKMWLSWMPRSAVLIGTVTAPIQAQPR